MSKSALRPLVDKEVDFSKSRMACQEVAEYDLVVCQESANNSYF